MPISLGDGHVLAGGSLTLERDVSVGYRSALLENGARCTDEKVDCVCIEGRGSTRLDDCEPDVPFSGLVSHQGADVVTDLLHRCACMMWVSSVLTGKCVDLVLDLARQVGCNQLRSHFVHSDESVTF